jgi:hypothetical protein
MVSYILQYNTIMNWEVHGNKRHPRFPTATGKLINHAKCLLVRSIMPETDTCASRWPVEAFELVRFHRMCLNKSLVQNACHADDEDKKEESGGDLYWHAVHT